MMERKLGTWSAFVKPTCVAAPRLTADGKMKPKKDVRREKVLLSKQFFLYLDVRLNKYIFQRFEDDPERT